jgi:hypothetical protein
MHRLNLAQVVWSVAAQSLGRWHLFVQTHGAVHFTCGRWGHGSWMGTTSTHDFISEKIPDFKIMRRFVCHDHFAR